MHSTSPLWCPFLVILFYSVGLCVPSFNRFFVLSSPRRKSEFPKLLSVWLTIFTLMFLLFFIIIFFKKCVVFYLFFLLNLQKKRYFLNYYGLLCPFAPLPWVFHFFLLLIVQLYFPATFFGTKKVFAKYAKYTNIVFGGRWASDTFRMIFRSKKLRMKCRVFEKCTICCPVHLII